MKKRHAWPLIALLLAAAPAQGQHRGPDPTEHVALLSVNALAGGLSAGVAAWMRGEDASRAFIGGAAGGVLSYTGKLTAAATFTAAPIVGRQVAAVGHGMMSNAGAGAGLLSEIWFPVSPLRVRTPVAGGSWGVQLDLMDTATLLYGVLQPHLRIDGGLSVQAGTPVFVAEGRRILLDGKSLGGLAFSGTILLSGDLPNDDDRRSVLAHELVHVIQNDFAKAAISYPVEGWIAGKLLPRPEVPVPVRGGFLAVLAELALGGIRNEGVLRELIESEARTIVQHRWEPVAR